MGALAGHGGAVSDAGRGLNSSGAGARASGGSAIEAGSAAISDAGNAGSPSDAGADSVDAGGSSAAGNGSGTAGVSGGSGMSSGGVGVAGGAGAPNGGAGNSGSSPGGAGDGIGGGAGGAAPGGGGGSAGSGAVRTGIRLTVHGLPGSASAGGTLLGPHGYASSVGLPSVIANLEPGSYTLTVASVRTTGKRLDSIFDASNPHNTVVVSDGALSEIDVSYGKRPGTGALWLTTSSTPSLVRLDDQKLDAIASANTVQSFAPDTVLVFPGSIGGNTFPPRALAFSETGDTWVGTCKPISGTVVQQVVAKYPPPQAGMSSTAQTVVALPAPSLGYDCVGSLEFDASGNLWVGMQRGVLMRFDKAALASVPASSSAVPLTPSVTIIGMHAFSAMHFDRAGNLYFSPAGATNGVAATIVRLSASQLTADNPQITPNVVLTMPSSFNAVADFTFDRQGNLWAPLYIGTMWPSPHQLVRFDKSALDQSGTLTPSLTFDGLTLPFFPTFDNLGALWVVETGSNSSSIEVVPPEQLAQSGTVHANPGYVSLPSTPNLLLPNPR